MKNLLCVIFTFLYITSWGQVVSSDSLHKYVDTKESVKVCDEVSGVYISPKKTAFINFGKSYPHLTFTAVIFQKTLEAKFDKNKIKALKGQYICITGKVIIYKDKPEIIINAPNQIIELK